MCIHCIIFLYEKFLEMLELWKILEQKIYSFIHYFHGSKFYLEIGKLTKSLVANVAFINQLSIFFFELIWKCPMPSIFKITSHFSTFWITHFQLDMMTIWWNWGVSIKLYILFSKISSKKFSNFFRFQPKNFQIFTCCIMLNKLEYAMIFFWNWNKSA